MAPEIQTGALTTAIQSDLMRKMDIWSLGILAHAMMKPNLSTPYSKEAEKLGVQFDMNMMKHFMQIQQLPSNDTKYESHRVARWQVEEVFSTCTKFDPNCRPSASEILIKVNIDDPEASLFIHPLQLHQGSALEHADAILAHRFHVESSRTHREFELNSQAPLIDDGMNACSFIAVAICDTFLNNCKNQDQCLSWNDAAGTAGKIIRKLPRKIGKLRGSSQTSGACEAKRILESNGLLEQQYDFSKECESGSRVFPGAGRDEIFKALGNISADVKNQVAVYTCTPYTHSR